MNVTTDILVWVQLCRWKIDQIHVKLVGRQTQISCNQGDNFDSLVRRLIHDDAYRDETASIGAAKLRVFQRLIYNHGNSIPVEELEPYSLINSHGAHGSMPLIVVVPPKYEEGGIQNAYSLNYLPIESDGKFPMEFLNSTLVYEESPPKNSTAPSKRKRKDLDLEALEEKRRADRARQRKCRARKKKLLEMKEMEKE